MTYSGMGFKQEIKKEKSENLIFGEMKINFNYK